jgi:hypothetical protein
MKISSKSGASARWLSALGGLALIVANGSLLYLRLPDIIDGTVPPLEVLVPVAVALSGLLLVVSAATLGRHEWIIGDTYLRIRAKKTPDVLVYPGQFETLERQTYELGGDSDNGLPCVSLIVGLTDGRVFESPRMFDDGQITRAWRKIEALRQSG